MSVRTARRHMHTALLRRSAHPRLPHHPSFPALRQLHQAVQIPSIFAGLLGVLWLWKTLVLVVLQDKVIYMNYLGRNDTVEQHATPGCGWREGIITTADGERLVLLHGRLHSAAASEIAGSSGHVIGIGIGIGIGGGKRSNAGHRQRLRLLYLQGNGGSSPMRLPLLSRLLHDCAAAGVDVDVCLLSYRGYWRSTGRPSEAGISIDVATAVDHILTQPRDDGDYEKQAPLVVWGHSVGAYFAMQAVLRHLDQLRQQRQQQQQHHHHHTVLEDTPSDIDRFSPRRKIAALVLETPFIDTPSVLRSLYPQKWLPYHHLGPWLRTRLDLPLLLRRDRPSVMRPSIQHRMMPALVIDGAKDEILPMDSGATVAALLSAHWYADDHPDRRQHEHEHELEHDVDHGQRIPSGVQGDTGVFEVERFVVKDGLHQDCLTKPGARAAAVEFLRRVVDGRSI